jgi:hypothetical protein
MREKRNEPEILVGKPEGKVLLGRPRHLWEVNIKMNLRDIGSGGKNWSHLAKERDQCICVLNAVMNLRVP